mgnify:CR=1 FL=1
MDLVREVRDWLYKIWIGEYIDQFKERGGKVVMITGSYGKTSVKELTYDLLRHNKVVVATGRNYNTAVGIAKTLYWEVLPTTQVLVVEVGAYHVGEISSFCGVLKPDIGVITGIARQHLTQFGSWQNIITAKTEIARYIQKHGGILVANGSDETVKENVQRATWYGGNGREEINRNGAILVAKEIGLSEVQIARRLKYIRAVPSRFEKTSNRYGMAVIDDSYNSNEKSFLEAIRILGREKKYTRILVTPGLLELGEETKTVHQELGKAMIGNVDVLILVGDNERTQAISSGVGGDIKTYSIARTLAFMDLVKSFRLKKEPLVLIENDVPENYL